MLAPHVLRLTGCYTLKENSIVDWLAYTTNKHNISFKFVDPWISNSNRNIAVYRNGWEESVCMMKHCSRLQNITEEKESCCAVVMGKHVVVGRNPTYMYFHFLGTTFTSNHEFAFAQNEVEGGASIQIKVANHSRELMNDGWSEHNYTCVATFTAEQWDALILSNWYLIFVFTPDKEIKIYPLQEKSSELLSIGPLYFLIIILAIGFLL